MTRIRRTVGTANEANETQVAAGVVNSLPIMDYTHTYWNGNKETSCDECPNAFVCPKCPQYNTTEGFRMRGGGVPTRDIVLDSYNERTEGFDPNQIISLDSSELLPMHDLDSGFVASRERMGACTTKQYCGNRAAGYVAREDNELGVHTDNKFGDTIALGRNACKSSSPATKLLYMDTMGMTNPDPAAEDCAFYGHNGYLYKEQC